MSLVPDSASAVKCVVHFKGAVVGSGECCEDPNVCSGKALDMSICDDPNGPCQCSTCEKVIEYIDQRQIIDYGGDEDNKPDEFRGYFGCEPIAGCEAPDADGQCRNEPGHCYVPSDEGEGCVPGECLQEDDFCPKDCEERECIEYATPPSGTTGTVPTYGGGNTSIAGEQPCINWGPCKAVPNCKASVTNDQLDQVKGWWNGDCGVGKFSATDDIWPSRTGCYNPEERFSYNSATLEITPPHPNTVPKIGVPRDDILVLNSVCMRRESVALENLIEGDESKKEVTVQCMNKDYTDDLDDFCKQYLENSARYNKDRWIWDGSCWKKEVNPAVFDVVQGDHWMPIALENSKKISIEGTPQSTKLDQLGEYGFRKTEIKKKWGFDRSNIYNYATPPTDVDIMKTDNLGVKNKKQECLKIFIEEYAQRGDCGDIVLDGAEAGIDESYCQWVAMYDATDGYNRVMHPLSKRPTGMRSEYYDYENFKSKGKLPFIQDFNICKQKTLPGNSTTFHPGASGGIDFSKRGCPSVSGPDLWPDFFDMKKCNSSVGAKRINNPLNALAMVDNMGGGGGGGFGGFGGGGFGGGGVGGSFGGGDGGITCPINNIDIVGMISGLPIGLTTKIEDKRSNLWGLRTGGVCGIPIFPANDWIDYSSPARSCDHKDSFSLDKDFWAEEPEYTSEDFLSKKTGTFSSIKNPPGYDATWSINEMQLAGQTQGAFWCEFETPFIPFESSLQNELLSRVPTEHFTMNSHLDGGQSPNGNMKLKFKMVERIRDGCGAFSQRATWKQDEEKALAKWLIGKKEARCQDWTGLYGKEYDDPKIVSWRLPRFNYEFLKAFIECTGPVRSPRKPCGSMNFGKAVYNAIPKQYGGCGCAQALDDATQPNSNFYHNEATGSDKKAKNDNNCNCSSRPEPNKHIEPTEPFGFWCKCPMDNFFTSDCNENFCTCLQGTLGGKNGMSPNYGIPGLVLCKDYGPFKRWLQCYYQARAKACPVLVRDISNGIPPSGAMRDETYDKSRPKYEDVCKPDPDAKASWTPIPLRFDAEEPNILARLSVHADPAASESGSSKPKDYKHHDLVFQSQVRDIEAPFIEPTIPYPLTKGIEDLIDKQKANINSDNVVFDDASKAVFNSRYEKALESSSKDFKHKGKSRISDIDPRAQEVVVGPRGCDIGGWYEMMLYQARCIKWFRLNCLCDYDKTFAKGSAEAYVTKRSGMDWAGVKPYLDKGPDLTEGTADDSLKFQKVSFIWPLKSRGVAGPKFAESAAASSKLEGLDNAKSGDILIWDETIKEEDGSDARYRRHVAYVESVYNDGETIHITEWNWGKNQDSCGNTDRWKTLTNRFIHKTDTVEIDGSTRGHCDDPDMRHCYERNWDRIKIYRQSEDISGANPVCDINTMPVRISGEYLRSQNIPNKRELSADPSVKPSIRDVINSGTWKYDATGEYDAVEVEKYITENLGKCDPPISVRTGVNIKKDGE